MVPQARGGPRLIFFPSGRRILSGNSHPPTAASSRSTASASSTTAVAVLSRNEQGATSFLSGKTLLRQAGAAASFTMRAAADPVRLIWFPEAPRRRGSTAASPATSASILGASHHVHGRICIATEGISVETTCGAAGCIERNRYGEPWTARQEMLPTKGSI